MSRTTKKCFKYTGSVILNTLNKFIVYSELLHLINEEATFDYLRREKNIFFIFLQINIK